MVLSPGMRTRFEALASYETDNLVKVELEKREPLFGYLRLVEGGSFVLEEVRRDEGKIIIIRETTLDIHLVTGFSKILPDDPDLPDRFLSFGHI